MGGAQPRRRRQTRAVREGSWRPRATGADRLWLLSFARELHPGNAPGARDPPVGEQVE